MHRKLNVWENQWGFSYRSSKVLIDMVALCTLLEVPFAYETSEDGIYFIAEVSDYNTSFWDGVRFLSTQHWEPTPLELESEMIQNIINACLAEENEEGEKGEEN